MEFWRLEIKFGNRNHFKIGILKINKIIIKIMKIIMINLEIKILKNYLRIEFIKIASSSLARCHPSL